METLNSKSNSNSNSKSNSNSNSNSNSKSNSNSNSNNSSLSTEYFTRDSTNDKDVMLERLKKVSDLGVKEYAFKGVGSTEAKNKKTTGEARIERLLLQNAKEIETQLQQIRNKMRNLYLEKGDPKYPPHNGSRGVAEFNALLHQRHGMFGFTKRFDDYRTITDLDVLKDMYNKMKTVYRENQPRRKGFEGARRSELKKPGGKESGYMPLHVKRGDGTFGQIRNKMNENYEGGTKRTRRRRRRRRRRRKTMAPRQRSVRRCWSRRTRRKRRY